MWHKNSSIDSSDVIRVQEGGLSRLTGCPIQALAHDSISICELWHRRFVHLHYKDLTSVKKMVTCTPDVQVENYDVCRGCLIDKNSKSPFHSSDSRSKGILNLVHSNICGSMSAPSLSGYLYYVIFIDDFSRKTWIYLLKSKDETFNKF